MNIKNTITVLLTLIGLTYSFAQDDVVSKLNKLASIGNISTAKELCTDGYWNAEKDAGKKVIPKVLQLKLTFRNIDVRYNTAKDRAVMTLELSKEGKGPNNDYMFFIKVNDEWLIDGFNKSTKKEASFLSGKINAH